MRLCWGSGEMVHPWLGNTIMLSERKGELKITKVCVLSFNNTGVFRTGSRTNIHLLNAYSIEHPAVLAVHLVVSNAESSPKPAYLNVSMSSH